MNCQNDTALLCKGLSKSFGQVGALRNANLTLKSGTIHALVGENGAGKSTLINLISGLLQPDSGSLHIFGKPTRFASALQSVAAGIGVVHQHFLLAEALTVAENIALGQRRSTAGMYFDAAARQREIAQLARQTELHVDPAARVRDLSVGMRQRVEILKALSRGASILLMDEPTAVLAPPEVETLFKTLRTLRDGGRTILIVTHKLDEVFGLASEVTVLRAGTTVFSSALSTVTPAELAIKMVGREPEQIRIESAHAKAPDSTVLRLKNVSVAGHLSIEELEVRAGEVAGITGVEGNGQSELAACIAGTLQPDSGEMTFWVGQTLTTGMSAPPSTEVDLGKMSVKERASAGLSYIPADRQRDGLILELTLTENFFLRDPLTRGARFIGNWRVLDRAEMTAQAELSLKSFGVTPADPELAVQALSGGNQQKVILARELSRSPRLIVACNPTRGLDVGAAAQVQQRLVDAACGGAAVLLISSDLDEVLALSDRVFVLYRGTLKFLGPRGASRASAGVAMAGLEKS